MSDFGGGFGSTASGLAVPIDFVANEANAREQAAKLGRTIEQALVKAFTGDKIGKAISSSITKGLKDSGFKGYVREVKDATDANKDFARSADDIKADLEDLARRSKAAQASFSKIGLGDDRGAVFQQQLEKILDLQRRFNKNFAEAADNPEARAAFQAQFKQYELAIGRETQLIKSELQSLRIFQDRELERMNQSATQSSRERIQISRAAQSKLVVQTQAAAAKELAATRAASAQQIQSARASARVRLEVLQFLLRQVRVIERGIAKAFVGTAGAVNKAFKAVGSGVARIGRSLRGGNADMTQGLEPALRDRERILRRSFSRQTTDITTAVTRQERIINQFEARASTGLAGVASGRSRLGALIGGGLAVGGGVVLARQLREGFDEAVNLNEQLNATAAIFGDATDAVVEFSEESVSALFLTQSAALEVAANFGAFGKQAGLAGKDLSDFSKRFSLLAADLASFKNTSVEDAATAISAAFRGEQEPIRRYNVLLDQATLEARAFAEGITEVERALTPQERVLAAAAEIMAQTIDAQGDAAKTADDFANSSKRLSAQITTTFAAIADFAKPLATVISNALYPALQGLTNFIEGDVNPALKTLRTALIGAGAALGLLLAAKAAGEAIRFLGISLRFTLTPLGAFVTAVALIGGAIAVLSQRSRGFAAVMEGIVEALKRLVGRGLDLAVRGFNELAGLITTVVLPAAERLARTVGGALLAGLGYVAAVVVQVIVPAFRDLGQLLTNTVVPAFITFGSFLAGTVVPALQAFGQAAFTVLSTVVSFLQPAIQGFVALGQAIAGAFTGDFAGVLDGFAALGKGIGEVFANLGILIYNALRPQVERAVAFVSEVFKTIDFTSIARTLLNVVELIGNILGRIVSDPRLLLALEAIAAAAIVVGVRFIKGFAEGVISNLPEIVDLLGGQLKTALGLVFENALKSAFDPKVILGVLAAISIGPALLRAFTRPVDQAGKRVGDGFFKNFAGGVRAGFQRNDLARGLFGGLDRIAEVEARKASKTLQREQRRAVADLKALGKGGLIEGFITGPDGSTERAVNGAIGHMDRLKGEFGAATTAGAVMRGHLQTAFRQVGVAAGGASQAMQGGFRTGFAQIATGAAGAAKSIGSVFRVAAQNLKATGIGVGQAIGGAIVSGVGAALAGQQLGSATSVGGQALGLAGVVSSALFASAATGNAAVGAIVGGIGLITAAITASGEAAALAAERAQTYADALTGLSGADAVGAATGEIVRVLGEQSQGVRDLLRDADFVAVEFAQAALSGDRDIRDIALNLAASIGLPTAAVKELDTALSDGALGSSDRFNLRALGDEFKQAGTDVDSFIDVVGLLGGEVGAVAEGLDRAQFKVDINPEEVEKATRKFNEQDVALKELNARFDATGDSSGSFFAGLGDGVSGALDYLSELLNVEPIDIADIFGFTIPALDRIKAFGINFSGLFSSITTGAQKMRDAHAEQVTADLEQAASDAAEALEAEQTSINLVTAAITDLNRVRTQSLNAQIAETQSRLQAAEQAANDARQALTAYLTGRYADTPQAAVDEVINNIGSVGSAIEDALKQGGTRGEAALRSAVGGFETQLAGVIRAGFDAGLRNPADFAALLGPIGQALNDEVGDMGLRIQTLDFTDGITPAAGKEINDALQRALNPYDLNAGIQGVFAAESEVDRIQRQLDAYQAQLETTVVFNPDQIADALRNAGASAQLIASLDFTQVEAQQQPGLAGSVAQADAALNAQQFPISGTPLGTTINNNFEITSWQPRQTAREVVMAQSASAGGGRAYVPVPV